MAAIGSLTVAAFVSPVFCCAIAGLADCARTTANKVISVVFIACSPKEIQGWNRTRLCVRSPVKSTYLRDIISRHLAIMSMPPEA
jgi:hypothetical protein